MRRTLPLLLLALALSAGSRSAVADIYTFTDDEGTVHFTNVQPKGKDKKKWTKVADEEGKGSVERGDCDGCDVVPAKDRSKARYARYDEHIAEAAELYLIPETLIRAVMKVESDFDPAVVSRVGARGLMQLMPGAASDMHVDDPHDPRQGILGGTRLLRVLANRFDGDLVKTIAAYHSGAGSVSKHGGVPPYPRVNQYVKMVLKEYYKLEGKAAPE